MLQAPWRGNVVADRLARRELVRHKGRSALIIALVMLPVMVVCALGMLAAQEKQDFAARQYGAATAKVEKLQYWDGKCQQSDLTSASCTDSTIQDGEKSPAPDWSAVGSLPQQQVPEVQAGQTVTVEGVTMDTTLAVVDLTSPHAAERWAVEPSVVPGAHEVLTTKELATRLNLRTGSQVTVGDSTYTVAGLVRTDEYGVGIVVAPEHPLARTAAASSRAVRTVFLYGDEPTLGQVQQLNKAGLGISTREAFDHMQGSDTQAVSLQALLLVVLVLATLLTSTIVGAAFAIGIRQQRRNLALLGATGAPGRTLQGVVVRQGLWLGLVGSLLGAVAGVAWGWAGVRWLNAADSGLPQPLRIPWLLLPLAILVGTASAVVAAWLPARRIASQDVMTSVRSAEASQTEARLPKAGLVLATLGLLAGLVGPRLWPSGGGRHPGTVPVETIVGPAAICVFLLFLASLFMIPWLLDRLGRRARGPLAWRMALRDGARNRSRATATVAASMAIASLAGALLVANQSMGQTDLDHYQYTSRVGVGSASSATSNTMTPQLWQRTSQVIQQVMPVAASAVVREPQVCDSSVPMGPACTNALMVQGDEVCNDRGGCSSSSNGVSVYEPGYFRVLTGRDATAEEKSLLARGGVLVSDGLPHGDAVQVVAWDPAKAGAKESVTVPAKGIGQVGQVALMDEATLTELATKAAIKDTFTFFDTGIDPTQAQVDQLSHELSKAGLGNLASVSVEQGPNSSYLTTQKWFALASAVLMLVVAALAGALALRDARDAHTSLAAIGASTATLRGMAAVQTMVAVGLGSLLGLLVGAVPMVLMVLSSMGGVSLGIPWGWLLSLLVVIPLVASGIAFLAVRPPVARAVRVD